MSPAELAGAALPAALAGSPDDKVAACQVLQELLTDVDLTFTTAPAAPLLEEAAVRQKRGRGQQPAGCASPEVAAGQSRGTRQLQQTKRRCSARLQRLLHRSRPCRQEAWVLSAQIAMASQR